MYAWGAYENIFSEDIPNSTNGDKHPGPSSDAALGYEQLSFSERERYYFGFASLAQMRQWVHLPKWRRALTEEGLQLVKYRVPREFFRRSQFQAIFLRDEAIVVERRRPDYDDRSRLVKTLAIMKDKLRMTDSADGDESE